MKNETLLKLLISAPNEETSQCIFTYVPESMCHINMSYERLDLPKTLIDRLDYWCKWYFAYAGKMKDFDKSAFRIYGISLSIDLKLFLGNTCDVCFDDLYGNMGQIEINLKEESGAKYPILNTIELEDKNYKFA